MRRRNYYLPDELVEQAQKLATRRQTSVSDIIRTALQKYMEAVERAEKAKNGQ